MNKKCFKSKGTIRVKLSKGHPPQIFFTPDADSTVRCGDKRYAVFLQESSEDCFVRKLGNAGEGVPINGNAKDLRGLVEAAVRQTLVEVAVQEDPSDAPATETQKDDPHLALCAITIPAPGKQK